MACAGDMFIMGRRLQDFEEVFTSLVKKKKRTMELEIHLKKDKI
jgi:hypothetical protein